MRSVAELDDRLSAPRPALVDDLRKIDGDLLVLGAGGKLGPSLVRLAVRAAGAAGGGRRVIAVSRFGGGDHAAELRAAGATVIAADIGDEAALRGLPDAPNVLFLVGAKFGTSGRAAATWNTNTYLPGQVARRFRGSRIVALSTGNVYPLTPVASAGPTEDAAPDPVGEYAMSCLGRERILEHASVENGTPTALIRLNYAVEMRYGVLVDLATALLAGEPVDLTMGHANVVWQGYANEVAIRALLLADVPPAVLNVTGPELVSIRQVATALADRLGVPVRFAGTEAGTALLSNAGRCHRLFGYPDVTLGELLDHTAAWVGSGLPLLGKPTGFQRRDGRF
ncbi:NAD(P)-dependent oxidoreductase [Streptosporangiaceae bacterium NEAU-GS5]|nr:NAD(P)-dependent oxidoreductase [Streptosporangiaceae bacterium NEAU-GS5]